MAAPVTTLTNTVNALPGRKTTAITKSGRIGCKKIVKNPANAALPVTTATRIINALPGRKSTAITKPGRPGCTQIVQRLANAKEKDKMSYNQTCQ